MIRTESDCWLSCLPFSIVATVLLVCGTAHADSASSPIAQVTIGTVTATASHTTELKLCPDNVTHIVKKSKVAEKITIPAAAFAGASLKKDLTASFGRCSATVKGGVTTDKTVRAFECNLETSHEMTLDDTTFKVTYDADPEQTTPMEEHIKLAEACPAGEKGYNVPSGQNINYQHQLGPDGDALLLLTTNFENLDDVNATYTYTIENPSTDAVLVVWKSVNTVATPGGWAAELEPGQSTSFELNGLIGNTFVNDDVAKYAYDPQNEITGFFAAPAILPNLPPPPLVPTISNWGVIALVLLLIAAMFAATRRRGLGLSSR